MNPINKRALELTNTTEEDYLTFCKMTTKSKVKTETRQEYFKEILNNNIVKDNKLGKIKIVGKR